MFSTSHTFSLLLVGRAIVGLGDALIWVNIVLILGKWFAPARFAAVLAVVNTAGNAGALITSIPLAALIAVAGWHIPFIVIGVLLVLSGIAAFTVLIGSRTARDAVAEHAGSLRVVRIPVGKALADVVRDRVAWSTFCCHFGAMGTYLSMVSLWIVPYFMNVYRLSRAEAAWFTLTAFVGALVAGPMMGWLSDFLHNRKRPYIVTQSLSTAAWLTVVLWGGQPPMWIAFVIMFVVGYGCGSTLLTFAVVRDRVAVERSGVTSGFANTGGFLSAVLLPVLFGAVIDAAGGGAGASIGVVRHAYCLAFILPTVFSAVGVFGTLLLPGRRATA